MKTQQELADSGLGPYPNLPIRSRAGFLAGVGTAVLAGCAGGSSLVPKGRGTDTICPNGPGTTTQSLCDPGGGGYTSTGGINPGAWANFQQVAAQTDSLSFGWNDNTRFAHGANAPDGSLLYTGSTSIKVSGGTLTATSTLSKMQNYPPGGLSSSIGFPSAIPPSGTLATSIGTVQIDLANGTHGTHYFNVRGVPCSLTMTPTDTSGQRFLLAYKNLNTGFVWTTPIVYPYNVYTSARGLHPMLSHAECRGAEVFLWSIACVGAVLTIIALPEAVAGAAYAAMMSGLSRGMTIGAAVGQGLLFIGCPL